MNTPRREQTIALLETELTAREEVLDAYVFGSLARGDDQPHSDVDVAVFVADSALAAAALRFGYQAELSADLQQALGRPDVDVVVLNQAPPVLYYTVLRDGVRIVSRDLSATTRREGNAFSRYCDDVPRLRRIDAIHRARIEAGGFGT